ncbi:MAG: rRNA maturation RNase YbeY [Candidatus Komeilibacteria bacterium]|nr:rRNA maturation RNase YbeY [Candidatus Komeilibacteria bacterium]
MIDAVFVNRSRAAGRIPRIVINKTLRRAERLYGSRLTNKHLAVVFVSTSEIKSLNRSYRGKNRATNVLSFTAAESQELGDIIICPAIAAAEARGADQSFTGYVNYLFIHGLLHLLGFDHNNAAAAMAMARAEKRLI